MNTKRNYKNPLFKTKNTHAFGVLKQRVFSSLNLNLQASEASLEAAKLAMRAVLTGAEELKQVSCGDDAFGGLDSYR